MPWTNRGDLATTAEANVISVAGRTGIVVLAKADVGLSAVDNTADADKPVSTAQAAADALKVAKAGDTMTGTLLIAPGSGVYAFDLTTNKGLRIRNAAADGFEFIQIGTNIWGWVPLTGTGAAMRLTASFDILGAASKLRFGAGAGTLDTNLYRSAPDTLATDDSLTVGGSLAVTGASVFTGAVTGLTKATVGLGNVDNTADADKPVSTAQADADATKLPLTGGTLTGNLNFSGVGAGIVWSSDTNLYRSAADTLKTNDSLVVGGDLTVTGTAPPGAFATGAHTATMAAATYSAALTFPVGRFTAAPTVIPTINSANTAGSRNKLIPRVHTVTATGFTLMVCTGDGTAATGTVVVDWLAYQPLA